VHWLFILGLSLDIAGAILVALAVFGTPGEGREAATARWNGNFWIVLIREREQMRVRAGVFLLGGGFVLQFAGYLASFESWRIPVAAAAGAGLGTLAYFVARGVADRFVPLKYHDDLDLPEGIEDQRHSYLLPTVDEIRTWWKLWSLRMLGREPRESDERIAAHIGHGRWLVDCPHCPHYVLMAWPKNERAFCTGCGTTYLVDFPDDYAEVERILLFRSVENRNWTPGETIAELRAENEAHGLPAA
jgi:hypothetical protein